MRVIRNIRLTCWVILQATNRSHLITISRCYSTSVDGTLEFAVICFWDHSGRWLILLKSCTDSRWDIGDSFDDPSCDCCLVRPRFSDRAQKKTDRSLWSVFRGSLSKVRMDVAYITMAVRLYCMAWNNHWLPRGYKVSHHSIYGALSRWFILWGSSDFGVAPAILRWDCWCHSWGSWSIAFGVLQLNPALSKNGGLAPERTQQQFKLM